MITNQHEYEQMMDRIAHFPAIMVGSPEEDILNDMIAEITQYENSLGIVLKDEDLIDTCDYNG